MRMIRFGNPILREVALKLSGKEIESLKTQKFIEELKQVINSKKYGVGLAAPQIGGDKAIAVIDIKPTVLRPNVEVFSMVIINPSYEGIGQRHSKWEGCLSSGSGNNTLYAKVLRYSKIHALWIDERGELHKTILEGLPAHVFQHETDHLNGILFVDKVQDTKSYMLAGEYKKRIAKNRKYHK